MESGGLGGGGGDVGVERKCEFIRGGKGGCCCFFWEGGEGGRVRTVFVWSECQP